MRDTPKDVRERLQRLDAAFADAGAPTDAPLSPDEMRRVMERIRATAATP